MPKFRKKPDIIEAVQWFKIGDDPDVYRFSTDDRICNICKKHWHEHGELRILSIFAYRSVGIVCPGDWICKDILDNKFIVKQSIFLQIYEEVKDDRT